MNAKDWKGAVEIARSIINEWDPHALLASGAPDDEFESEIASIVRQLPRIRSRNDAVLAIARVFSSAFEPDCFRPEEPNCLIASRKGISLLPSKYSRLLWCCQPDRSSCTAVRLPRDR
jgi:hypothetical protein